MTDAWGDPLLEPQKVSGGSIKTKLEAIKDRNGKPIMSSSHEMYRGPQVEMDSSHSVVRIEQNVSTLELGLCTSLMDHLNDDTLWGIDARRIKLSDFRWEEKWYDVCTYYYTRMFEFEIKNNPDDLWDFKLVDEGTRALNGRWVSGGCGTASGVSGWELIPICGTLSTVDPKNPDPTNPQHFVRYKDRNGENTRVILNGEGLPASTVTLYQISLGDPSAGTGTTPTGDAVEWDVEYYPEEDFTQLGIPTTIDFGTAT
jgi:hypothetical protein